AEADAGGAVGRVPALHRARGDGRRAGGDPAERAPPQTLARPPRPPPPRAPPIKPWLTPLAACGLVIIMGGAIWIGLISPDPKNAIPPLIVALLLLFVAYGRSRMAPPPA